MGNFTNILQCLLYNVSDTERLYTQMMQTICEPHGKEFTWDVKVKQMGHKEHESAQILIGELIS